MLSKDRVQLTFVYQIRLPDYLYKKGSYILSTLLEYHLTTFPSSFPLPIHRSGGLLDSKNGLKNLTSTSLPGERVPSSTPNPHDTLVRPPVSPLSP